MEHEEHENQAFGNIDMLKALLRMFLINVLRYGKQAQGQQAYELKPARMLFLQFRQAVERHYREKHSVQDYADLLNVAARTLNKCVNDCWATRRSRSSTTASYWKPSAWCATQA